MQFICYKIISRRRETKNCSLVGSHSNLDENKFTGLFFATCINTITSLRILDVAQFVSFSTHNIKWFNSLQSSD